MIPTVSVIMSVYNGLPYLHEAIESILSQTFRDFEFIIINDGSMDGTGDVLEQYAITDKRIFLVHQKNMGLTLSLNKGLSFAQGMYIARQDADDISLPHRIQMQVSFLDEYPDVGLLGTGIETIGEKSKKGKIFIYPEEHKMLVESWLLKLRDPFPHTSVMFRSEVLKKVGKYNPFYKKAQDYDLWLRVSERFKVASLPIVLCKLRIHSQSVSHDKGEQLKYALLALGTFFLKKRNRNNLGNFSISPQFVKDFESWFYTTPYPRRFKAKSFFNLVRAALYDRNYWKAFRYLVEATKVDPTWWCYQGVHLNLESALLKLSDFI